MELGYDIRPMPINLNNCDGCGERALGCVKVVKELESDIVVLAADGIGTPVVFPNSEPGAGTHLFADAQLK